MANDLTGLIAPIYNAMNEVSREAVGLTRAVTIDSSIAQRAAVGQTVRAPVAPAAVSTDVVASMTIPEGSDQSIGYVDMSITDSKGIQIPWPAEDQLSVGANYQTIFGDQMKEAFRALTNMIETSVASNYVKASRAYGTATTTPFAAGVGDAAQVRKLLIDNGAMGDLRLVVDTSAGANLRTNTQLTKANEAGSDDTLRRGTLLDLANIGIHESGQIQEHTKGTGTGYLVNGTPAVGDTVIPVDTGSGTILAGDIITFAGDTKNKYVVTGALSGGNVTIGGTGLRLAPADDAEITVGDGYTANMAFARSAVVLSTRPPAKPDGGDAAVDSMIVTDPISGINFEVSVYVGFKKKMIEVAVAWGSQVVNDKHSMLLLG